MTTPPKIRIAAAEDYEAFCTLFLELGIDDPVPDRSQYARDLMLRMFVAQVGSQVVGYTLHELLDGTGYVRNLVVAPAFRGRGIGRALMEHLRRFFDDQGASRWCLNVEPSNTAAVTLYARCGLQLAYEARALRVAADAFFEPDASTPEVDVRPVEPARDADLEQRFGLIRGQLASARAHPGREVLVFTEAGRPCGVAVFDPRFPGAFPFRLADARLAPGVLAYFRRRAPAHARWVQVVVEDDEPLAEALIERGATTALTYVHMRGSVRATD
jgi:ribosomal protein S18 acetylase RimI-like enzyme